MGKINHVSVEENDWMIAARYLVRNAEAYAVAHQLKWVEPPRP